MVPLVPIVSEIKALIQTNRWVPGVDQELIFMTRWEAAPMTGLTHIQIEHSYNTLLYHEKRV